MRKFPRSVKNAGTVQAFVPDDMLEDFVSGMEDVLGRGSCHVLSIRPQGGIEIVIENNC